MEFIVPTDVCFPVPKYFIAYSYTDFLVHESHESATTSTSRVASSSAASKSTVYNMQRRERNLMESIAQNCDLLSRLWLLLMLLLYFITTTSMWCKAYEFNTILLPSQHSQTLSNTLPYLTILYYY